MVLPREFVDFVHIINKCEGPSKNIFKIRKHNLVLEYRI